jgi:hypothetical protein
MTDSVSGWRFERGLDDDFMSQLGALAKGGWFADVLADPDLILGIRKNYLNVYRHGQSLFMVKYAQGQIKISTHPKYLVDPDLHVEVPFVDGRFQIDQIKPLIRDYIGRESLGRMKRAANLYRGDEKVGVQAIVRANPDVIDVEVAFSSSAGNGSAPSAPRIDIASLEEVEGTIRLRFWEAKLHTNVEVRASGDALPRVFKQIGSYRTLVSRHRDELVQSYRAVARNLVDLSAWAVPARSPGALIRRVAMGEMPIIEEEPVVGLVVYGYDDAHRSNNRWTSYFKKLEGAGIPVLLAGDPRNLRLSIGQFPFPDLPPRPRRASVL